MQKKQNCLTRGTRREDPRHLSSAFGALTHGASGGGEDTIYLHQLVYANAVEAQDPRNGTVGCINRLLCDVRTVRTSSHLIAPFSTGMRRKSPRAWELSSCELPSRGGAAKMQ
jgi:hypothetical protein